MKHREHRPVLRQDFSCEACDPDRSRRVGEAAQEHGAEAMLLVNVGDHEGYLRFAVVIETVVATDGDEFASALDDESHSGLTVDVSKMCDFACTQILVWIEIAQPNGLRREAGMESQ